MADVEWVDHHEAGEDHSQRRRSRGRGQDGRPEEDEDVHAALDDALHQPDQEDGAVAPDQQRPLAVGRNQVDALFEIKQGSLSYWHCFGQWLLQSGLARASWQRGGGFEFCQVLGILSSLLQPICMESGPSRTCEAIDFLIVWLYNMLSNAAWGKASLIRKDWAKKPGTATKDQTLSCWHCLRLCKLTFWTLTPWHSQLQSSLLFMLWMRTLQACLKTVDWL